MEAALQSTQRWFIRWPSSLTKKSVWLCSQGEANEALPALIHFTDI
jgi:hypothetical protein